MNRLFPALRRSLLGAVLLAAAFAAMVITLDRQPAPPPPSPDGLTAPVDGEQTYSRVEGASVAGDEQRAGLPQQAASEDEGESEDATGGDDADEPVEPAAPETYRVTIPGLAMTPPPPPPPPPSAEFLALGDRIKSTVDGYWSAGRYAVAVTDLQTGYTVGAYLDRQQLSGCVMNLFVIMRALKDVQDGRYPLDRVDSLIRATIWSSNATTARELYRIVGDGDIREGVRRVATFNADLGLREFIIDHPPAYTESIGVNANNWITAGAVNRALKMLWDGEILDEAHRAYLLEAMVDVKPGLNYLVAAVPGPARVSHKNGFFPSSIGYIDNDAGIVRVNRDGVSYAYAVTFLSEAVPVKYNDIGLAQEVGRLAYEHFAATYGQ